MLSAEDEARLRHMLDHAREALALVEGKTRPDLYSSRILSLALVRLLEIVGEAAGRASPEVTSRYPAIPWAEIVGLRNRLVHGYDSVDLDIMWQILKGDLPPLILQLEQMLSSTQS